MIRSNHVRTFLFLFPFACLGAASCAQVLGLDKYTDGVCNPGEKRTCYAGAAGTEGIGICKAGTETCEPHGQFWDKCVGSILPAASEDCDNHVDDDCNGKVNDTCGCIAGSMMACYTGAEGTEGKGICHGGMATCNADGVGYGDCEGEQRPLTEDCATPADENCDGVANEATAGCGCTPNAIVSCYTGAAGTEDKGVCKPGTKVCNNEGTAYGPCTGEITPAAAEDCSTPEDENCDGVVNEDCGCEPGTSASCYTGPAATENVGVCKSGTKVCNANGLDYGPCTGDVLPGTEDYTNPQDEDCDGFAGGETLWAKRFGDGAEQLGAVAAVDGAGNVYHSGYFIGGMQIGTTSLIATYSAGYAAKFDSSGAALWARSFESPFSNTALTGMAVDAAGNVFLSAYSSGQLDYGCGVVPGGPSVAKLDATGACLWSKACTASSNLTTIRGIVVDTAGNAVLVGSYYGSLNCGSGTYDSVTGSSDMFVVKLAPDGTTQWTRSYGDNAVQQANAAALDGAGNVWVTGVMNGTVTFSGTTVMDTGNGSAFLLRLSNSGFVLAAKGWPNSAGYGIAVDRVGGPVLTGVLSGDADFGGGMLSTAGSGDVFVARLGASGNHVWSARYGDAGNQAGTAVGVDLHDNVVVTGAANGAIDFGGGALPNGGFPSTFVANFGAAGSHRWSRSYTGSDAVTGRGLALGLMGDVYLAGAFKLVADFGTGPLTAAGGNDAFLMKIAP